MGARVIERLAADLRRDSPDMTGLSARDPGYMKAFAEAYSDFDFLQQVLQNCHGAVMSVFWTRVFEFHSGDFG